MLRPCIPLLIFVVLSSYAGGGASSLRAISGTVVEWQTGRLIAVANEQTGPAGVRIALRDTVYGGSPTAMRPGVRVTVWYALVGERLPVASKVAVVSGVDEP